MSSKLTLRIDENLIKAAKRYSAQKGKSVSMFVADFFRTLQSEEFEAKQNYSPTVKSLKGILKGKKISESDHKRFLEEKYY